MPCRKKMNTIPFIYKIYLIIVVAVASSVKTWENTHTEIVIFSSPLTMKLIILTLTW